MNFDDPKDLSIYIQGLLDKAGISRIEASKILGINKAYVSDALNREGFVHTRVRKLLLKLFGKELTKKMVYEVENVLDEKEAINKLKIRKTEV